MLLGKIKQGLIWHFQGSGKSLLMVFTALKLRAMAELTNPTILIVVDRIDLDTQITGTFNASDVPGLVSTDSRAQLQTLLSQGARKVIITTIHKFGEAPGVSTLATTSSRWSTRRTARKRCDYGQKMREALPNAFLFGLTGTRSTSGPQHVHVVRVARGRGRLPVALLLPRLDPGRCHPAVALRAAPLEAPHRPGGDRRRLRGAGC